MTKSTPIWSIALIMTVFGAPLRSQVWSWQNPKPAGENLEAITGFSANNIYAVGDFGCVLHFDGTSWKKQKVGFTHNLLGIWGSSDTDLFVVAQDGTLSPAIILHYDGTAWETMDPGSASATATLFDVWGSAPDNVYAVGGTTKHYDGTQWERMNSLITDNLKDVFGFSGSEIFAVGPWGIRECDGSIWSTMTQPAGMHSWYGIWGTSSSNMYAVGASDTQRIIRYGGGQWNLMNTGLPTPPGAKLNAVFGTAFDSIFAVGQAGEIDFYDDNMAGTWTSMDSGTQANLTDVWGADSAQVFAVGDYGTIIEYDGTDWEPTNDSAVGEIWLDDFWANNSEELYACGTIFLQSDGQDWWEVALPFGLTPKRMWGYSPPPPGVTSVFLLDYNDIYRYDGTDFHDLNLSGHSGFLTEVFGFTSDWIFVATTDYEIWRYYSGSWTKESLPPKPGLYPDINAIWALDNSAVFAVGDDGLILKFGASPWTEQPSGTAQDLISVWGRAEDDVYAISTNQVLHFDGLDWAEVYSGENFTGISGSESHVYISKTVNLNAMEGAIVAFDGQTWSEQSICGPYLRGIWSHPAIGTFAVGKNAAILRNVRNIDCEEVFDLDQSGNGLTQEDFFELLNHWPGQGPDLNGNSRVDLHELVIFEQCSPL